uniref:Uncharacterized protein n=1 Tax=Romanomermis culicivorax TaxID=13658 RepID=A0A915KAL7_ROMCU
MAAFMSRTKKGKTFFGNYKLHYTVQDFGTMGVLYNLRSSAVHFIHCYLQKHPNNKYLWAEFTNLQKSLQKKRNSNIKISNS